MLYHLPIPIEAELETEIDIPCGNLSVEVTNIDMERGWAYLKYKVGDETRWSDKLNFEGKVDRNVIYIRDADVRTLLSVDACDEEGCQLQCQKMDFPQTCDYLN